MMLGTGCNTRGSQQETAHKPVTSCTVYRYRTCLRACACITVLCCKLRPSSLYSRLLPHTVAFIFFFPNHVRADVWHEINWELCVGSGGHRARCFNVACNAARPGDILKRHIVCCNTAWRECCLVTYSAGSRLLSDPQLRSASSAHAVHPLSCGHTVLTYEQKQWKIKPSKIWRLTPGTCTHWIRSDARSEKSHSGGGECEIYDIMNKKWDATPQASTALPSWQQSYWHRAL